MPDGPFENIIAWIIGIAFWIVLFLIIRSVILWYWRINRIVELLEKLVDQTKPTTTPAPPVKFIHHQQPPKLEPEPPKEMPIVECPGCNRKIRTVEGVTDYTCPKCKTEFEVKDNAAPMS